jgi:hypothetical protein
MSNPRSNQNHPGKISYVKMFEYTRLLKRIKMEFKLIINHDEKVDTLRVCALIKKNTTTHAITSLSKNTLDWKEETNFTNIYQTLENGFRMLVAYGCLSQDVLVDLGCLSTA